MKAILIHVVLITFAMSSPHSYGQRIAAGGRHSLSICADSTVEAWGYNGFGQLGNGNTTEQHSGAPVIGLNGIVQVAGGLFHSLFVKSDGTVFSCGRNPLGNLGDGTNDDTSIPVKVVGLTNIVQAAGGGEHSLFLKRDGTVWACGNNSSGQLGDGGSTHRNTPVQVQGLSDIVQVAAGAEFSLFLKNNGTVWSCGHNGYGQFGNGTNSSSKVPVQLIGLSDVIQLSAGEWHSLFLRSDGTVYSAGRNQYGQLGDGKTANTNTAALITTLSSTIQVEAGGIHSVFLRSDGTVWSCGLNSGGNNDGQLGDGTTTDRHSPVPVVTSWGIGKIVRAEATREHSLFQKSDGSIWGVGRNNYGQLGYGAFTTPNSHTSVLSSAVCGTVETSMNEPFNDGREVQLFPNPNNGILFVKANTHLSQIEVVTVLGKRIYSQHVDQHHNSLEIDLSDKPDGIYFVRIMNSGSRVITMKIILQ